MFRYFSLALATAATLTTVAVAATTGQETRQTPGANIMVMTCNPHRHSPGEAHPWIDPYGSHRVANAFPYDEGFLAIDYKNDAKMAATEIDFGLVVRDSLIATAKDTGTFSPGIKIQHEFVISREVFPIGTTFPYCAVLRVKYRDGSEWHNPNPPPTG
jgi:hypothetical protein